MAKDARMLFVQCKGRVATPALSPAFEHVVNLGSFTRAPHVVDDDFATPARPCAHFVASDLVDLMAASQHGLSVRLGRGALRKLETWRAVHVGHRSTLYISPHFLHEKKVHDLGIRTVT